jgi:hypothetical protein
MEVRNVIEFLKVPVVVSIDCVKISDSELLEIALRRLSHCFSSETARKICRYDDDWFAMSNLSRFAVVDGVLYHPDKEYSVEVGEAEGKAISKWLAVVNALES